MPSGQKIIEFRTVNAGPEDLSQPKVCSTRPPALSCRWIATGDPVRPLESRWSIEESFPAGQRIGSGENKDQYGDLSHLPIIGRGRRAVH